MIPFPLDTRALIVIALVVVSLLLMIFAPQAMSNLIGEPFSLVGRLMGTIADWLQKGADKLFAIVKSVFLIGHPVKKSRRRCRPHRHRQRHHRTIRRKFWNILPPILEQGSVAVRSTSSVCIRQ